MTETITKEGENIVITTETLTKEVIKIDALQAEKAALEARILRINELLSY